MARGRGKSATMILLDIVRNLLAFGATGVVVFFIWRWNRIAVAVTALFSYIITLNVIGFLMLPLYGFTPENRLGRKIMQSIQDGDLAKTAELNAEFARRFHASVPKNAPGT